MVLDASPNNAHLVSSLRHPWSSASPARMNTIGPKPNLSPNGPAAALGKTQHSLPHGHDGTSTTNDTLSISSTASCDNSAVEAYDTQDPVVRPPSACAADPMCS